MNQIKTGNFIKELRREKGMTQEELAEELGTYRRTVSRWETGRNLPDIDILLEMSELFNVELIEIIDGERKNSIDIKESSIKVADYSEESKRKLMRNMHYLFIGGTLAGIIYMILLFTDHQDNFFGGLCLGIMFGMLIVGVIMTSRYGFLIREKKLSLFGKLGVK